MSTLEISHVKRYLRDYRYWQEKVTYLNQELERVRYEMSQVKGVSFDHEGGVSSYHSGAKPDRFYELLNEADKISADRSIAIKHVTEIQRICEEAEDSYIMTEVFVNGRSYREVGNDLAEKDGAIWYDQLIDAKIRRAIRLYLENNKK